MSTLSVAQPRIFDRIHTAQATAWVLNKQASGQGIAFSSVRAGSLTIHAVPSGNHLFTLDWSDQHVTVSEASYIGPPYLFSAMRNALVLLDALLMRNALNHIVAPAHLAATAP